MHADVDGVVGNGGSGLVCREFMEKQKDKGARYGNRILPDMKESKG